MKKNKNTQMAVMRAIHPRDYYELEKLIARTWDFKKYLKPEAEKQFVQTLTEDLFVPGIHTRIICVDDKPVALLAGWFASKEEPASPEANLIELLLTDPKYRRKGLAKKLLRNFENHCFARNKKPIRVISDSECAWPFYTNAGFSRTGMDEVEIHDKHGFIYTYEKMPEDYTSNATKVASLPFLQKKSMEANVQLSAAEPAVCKAEIAKAAAESKASTKADNPAKLSETKTAVIQETQMHFNVPSIRQALQPAEMTAASFEKDSESAKLSAKPAEITPAQTDMTSPVEMVEKDQQKAETKVGRRAAKSETLRKIEEISHPEAEKTEESHTAKSTKEESRVRKAAPDIHMVPA